MTLHESPQPATCQSCGCGPRVAEAALPGNLLKNSLASPQPTEAGPSGWEPRNLDSDLQVILSMKFSKFFAKIGTGKRMFSRVLSGFICAHQTHSMGNHYGNGGEEMGPVNPKIT